jgi:secondary thiamine-phosphate synthase enzyme
VTATRTAARIRITDITDDVVESIRRSGVAEGICWVRTNATTCNVHVNECESGLFADLESLLERLVPLHDPSGHRSRCLSMLLGPSGEAIPVQGGELCLGAWQRVLLVQHDGTADHEPAWHVAVLGAA